MKTTKSTKTTEDNSIPIATEAKSKSIAISTEDTNDTINANQIVIEVLPFRVRRMDTNNIVIERLKKRVTSDDTYWDIEGYYSNVISAIVKLFYKDINSQELRSIKEVALAVQSAETRIKDAIKSIKM